jgi:hypothetical protein
MVSDLERLDNLEMGFKHLVNIMKAWSIGQAHRSLYDMLNGDLSPDNYMMEMTDGADKELERLEKEFAAMPEDSYRTKVIEDMKWTVARIREWKYEKK